MTFIEGKNFYIGDRDTDGNVEVAAKEVKLFGIFSVGDIKVELPTGILVNAGLAVAKGLPNSAPLRSVLTVIDRISGR